MQGCPLPVDQSAVDRAVVRMRTIPIRCPVCGAITAATRFSENLRESGLCRHCGATNRNRQLAFVAARHCSGSLGSATKLTAMPSLGKLWRSRLSVSTWSMRPPLRSSSSWAHSASSTS